jgi:hypothetical protein
MPDPYNLSEADFIAALEHLGVINPGDPQPFEDGSCWAQVEHTWILEGTSPPLEEDINAAHDILNP